MIGLMFLAGIAVWIAIANLLSKRVPDWLGMDRFQKSARYVSFIILLLLPISDELIGRWQFHRLCEREAVVWLSPDWEKVKRAKTSDTTFTNPKGYLIRIQEQSIVYIDADTGKPFLKSKMFHTSGGILFDRLGLGLGTSTSCRPPDRSQIYMQVNIDQLVEKGKQGAPK